jgi:hypothetical protein
MAQELNEQNFEVGTSRIFLVIHHRHSPEFIAQAIKILDLDTLRRANGSFLMAEIEAGILEAAGFPLPTGDEPTLVQDNHQHCGCGNDQEDTLGD